MGREGRGEQKEVRWRARGGYNMSPHNYIIETEWLSIAMH